MNFWSPRLFPSSTWERQRIEGMPVVTLLLADQPDWLARVERCLVHLEALVDRRNVDSTAVAEFHRFIAREIAPNDTGGLCLPEARNMYRYTAADTAEE